MPLTVLHLLPFILRTPFRISSKSWSFTQFNQLILCYSTLELGTVDGKSIWFWRTKTTLVKKIKATNFHLATNLTEFSCQIVTLIFFRRILREAKANSRGFRGQSQKGRTGAGAWTGFGESRIRNHVRAKNLNHVSKKSGTTWKLCKIRTKIKSIS